MPEPYVIHTTTSTLDRDPAVGQLVCELRDASDACLFVSGGAGNMRPEHRDLIRDALTAVPRVQRSGLRLVAGDGGTQAGVMELLGDVRATADNPFPLLGIVPAPEVPPEGTTPVDPHHSHIVAVTDEDWPAGRGWWGSETAAMFALFGRLAEGRAAVVLVANGGAVTIDEVERHAHAGRPVVVLAGSGRTADALARRLGYPASAPAPDELALEREVERRGLLASPAPFVVVPVVDGPDALTAVLLEQLRKSAP